MVPRKPALLTSLERKVLASCLLTVSIAKKGSAATAINDNIVALHDYMPAINATTESTCCALQANIDGELDRRKSLIDYSGLKFNEMLMACSIDGIDLTQEPEYPHEMEL